MIYYGIPSYRRSFCTNTIDYLESLGVPKERIILSLQDEQDVKDYTAAGFDKRCVIITCKGDRVSKNRNNILEYAQATNVKRLLMLDDDVPRIEYMDGNRVYHKINSEKQLIELFEFCESIHSPIFGFYPTKSKMYQTPYKIRFKCMCAGGCLGILDTSLRFDVTLRMKEDYDFCLNVINQRRLCVRFDYITPVTISENGRKGGCSEDYKANRSEEASKILLERYPFLIKENPRRKGEIIMQNIE